MGHKFVALFSGGIKANRIIHLIIFIVRHFSIKTIDGAGRCVNKMPYSKVPAGFKNVKKTHKITLKICIRVCDGITDSRLGRQIYNLIESILVEESVN